MTHHVVTGSATADGGPLYLTLEGAWSRSLDDAERLDESTARERAAAAHAQAQATVCDPYVIAVVVEGDSVHATSRKERIRATGPTISFGVPT